MAESWFRLLVARGERKVCLRALLSRYSNLLRLFAEFLVHRRDGIRTRRQALDVKTSVGAANAKKWIRCNIKVHPHPRMLIALQGHHGFGLRKGFLYRRAFGLLRNVPLHV